MGFKMKLLYQTQIYSIFIMLVMKKEIRNFIKSGNCVYIISPSL